ncbi:hypothetical protein Pcinc_037470 [Petrolisthes cinctipes]|uniref:Uncharacterized protein n=1 Tax=Petrolisthes cinctipes TaxID=88211 RepID=A0AAE1ELD0_PETCI|nr:hypothetical protein Pcinc_037470 [Petrolisthes cinctipes]
MREVNRNDKEEGWGGKSERENVKLSVMVTLRRVYSTSCVLYVVCTLRRGYSTSWVLCVMGTLRRGYSTSWGLYVVGTLRNRYSPPRTKCRQIPPTTHRVSPF